MDLGPEVPPLPPADLHERPLTLADVAGQPLWRIHQAVHDPLFFGPPEGVRATGRWDAPAGQFGVCYLAVGDARIAFAETMLRGPSTIVGEKELAQRSLARFDVVAPLRLATMHGPGLIRMGATAAVSSGPHEFSRRWSLALHEHPDRALPAGRVLHPLPLDPASPGSCLGRGTGAMAGDVRHRTRLRRRGACQPRPAVLPPLSRPETAARPREERHPRGTTLQSSPFSSSVTM